MQYLTNTSSKTKGVEFFFNDEESGGVDILRLEQQFHKTIRDPGFLGYTHYFVDRRLLLYLSQCL